MTRYRFDEIAINSTAKKKPVEEDKYHYLGLEHLDKEDLFVHRFGSDVAPIGEKLIMHKGDVLFGKRRAYQKKVAIAPFDGIFSAHGMVLKPNEKVVDPSFFPLFMSSDYFLKKAIRLSVGSLSPTINWSDLRKAEFNLPSLDEQRKLAEVLWSLVETKEAYRDLLQKTDELVKSQFTEMFGDIESNPKGFDKRPLTDVCDFQGGSQPPKKDWIKEPQNGYIRMLQIRDFTQSEKDFVEYVRVSNSLKICDSTDILIGRYGASVGKVLTGLSGAYNVAIIKSIPDDQMLDRGYLYYYFLSDYFQKYVIETGAGRGAQAGFNKDDLSKISILIPPMSMQIQFHLFVEQVDKSKTALKQALDALNKTYKKIVAENIG